MPELPEVQTITSDLNKYLKNVIIKKVDIENSYKLYELALGLKTQPNNDFFTQKAIGQTIVGVSRIAKNINIELANDFHILIHLAMTGQLLLRLPSYPKDRFQKVAITFQKADGPKQNKKSYELRFCDMRMFGKMVLILKKDLSKFMEKYGYDALNTDLTPEIFLKTLKSKRTIVKNILLDQKKIAGLGNIYATDALFLSGIHPETPTGNIDSEMAKTLLNNVRTVLNEGIKNRGSTLNDEMYVDVFDRPGKHQNFFKIYGKKACIKCNSKVQFKKLNGRGTYFCPVCQPLA